MDKLKDYRLDFARERVAGTAQGEELLYQQIRKYLLTPRGACLLYPAEYGILRDDLPGKPADYVRAILRDRLREGIRSFTEVTADPEILFSQEEDRLQVTVTVSTVYGTRRTLEGGMILV